MATAAGVACALLATAGAAQQYPVKPVRFIIPQAAGGSTDTVSRIVGQKLSEALGQQVVSDNRAGANGIIGTEAAAKSPGDGYTLLAGGTATISINVSLYEKLPYDPVKDFTPVANLAWSTSVLVVHPSVPAKNIKDLIALARAKPDGMSYATSGQGSIVHLSTELFLHMAKIKAVHIPYKGTGPALTDTMAGNTQFLFGSIAAALPVVKQGRLRGIAVTTAKRVPALPDMPTIAESGVKGYDVILWHGLIGPKGLPRPIVDRVNGDLNKALKVKDMEEKLAADGVTAAGGTPEQFAGIIKRDIEVWRGVVKRAGVKAE
jgi:tripartite-type tricarboxylate transporter receptor subunit TctC